MNSTASEKAMAKYKRMIDMFLIHFPVTSLTKELIINAGGSKTAHLFKKFGIDFVTDVGIGSAFLCPGNFSELENLGFQNALCFFAPIVRVVPKAQLPFLNMFNVI
jgi:hypothetical protein